MIRRLRNSNFAAAAVWLCVAGTTPAGGQETDRPSWYWMEACAGPTIRVELQVDGRGVDDAAFPVCKRLHSAKPPALARTLNFHFAPARSIIWSGYKDNPETSPANSILEFSVWQASSDYDALLLGIAVMAEDNIFMSVRPVVFPGRITEVPLADGVVMRFIPISGD